MARAPELQQQLLESEELALNAQELDTDIHSPNFFDHFASHLRVQSQVDDLCHHKRRLSLPPLMGATKRIGGETGQLSSVPSSLRNFHNVGRGAPSRNLQLLSHTLEEQIQLSKERIKVSALDMAKRTRSILNRSPSTQVKLSPISSSKKAGFNLALGNSRSSPKNFGQQSSFGTIAEHQRDFMPNHVQAAIEEGRLRKNITDSKALFAQSTQENQSDQKVTKPLAMDPSRNNSSFRVDVLSPSQKSLSVIPRLQRLDANRSAAMKPVCEPLWQNVEEPKILHQMSQREHAILDRYKARESVLARSPSQRRTDIESHISQLKFLKKEEQLALNSTTNSQTRRGLQLETKAKSPGRRDHHIDNEFGKIQTGLYRTDKDLNEDQPLNLQIRKLFNKKLELANNRTFTLIHHIIHGINEQNAILEFKNQLQKDPTTYLGFKSFDEIQREYFKRASRKLIKPVKENNEDSDAPSVHSLDMKDLQAMQRSLIEAISDKDTAERVSNALDDLKVSMKKIKPETEPPDLPSPIPSQRSNILRIYSMATQIPKGEIFDKWQGSKLSSRSGAMQDTQANFELGLSRKASSRGTKVMFNPGNKLFANEQAGGQTVMPDEAHSIVSQVQEVDGEGEVGVAGEELQQFNDRRSSLRRDSLSIQSEAPSEVPAAELPATNENAPDDAVSMTEQSVDYQPLTDKEKKRELTEMQSIREMVRMETDKGKSINFLNVCSPSNPAYTVPKFYIARKSYKKLLSKPEIKGFKKLFTNITKNHKVPVNPYPILQQLIYQRLVVRNQNYAPGIMFELIQRSLDLLRPVRYFMLDGCELDDGELHEIVQLLSYRLQSDPHCVLTDLALVNMSIGPQAIAAILQLKQLLHTKSLLFLTFKNCKFLVQQLDQQPLLAIMGSNLRYLAMNNVDLNDAHVDLLVRRAATLYHLDVSDSQISPNGMLSFLDRITAPNATAHLKSLVLAGADLICPQPMAMRVALEKLMGKKGLQHLDFTDSKIDLVTLEFMLIQLEDSKTLIALHLTKSKAIRDIVRSALGDLLFEQLVRTVALQPLPKDWFTIHHVPHLTQDDIGDRLQPNLLHRSRYVLSRLMGRLDLANNLDIQKVQPRKEHERIVEKDPIRREAEIKRLHSYRCWIESEECWVCQRWNYILPVVTRNDILECCSGDEQLFALTPNQNRTLERIIDRNRPAYERLPYRELFIVGELTNFEFVRLGSLVDFMLKMDPQAEKVKRENYSDQQYMYEHYRELFIDYCQVWEDDHKRASTTFFAPYRPKVLCLEPDKPNPFDFGLYDHVMCGSFLARPGPTKYYLIYKLDDTTTFKTQQTHVVPIRKFEIHNYTIPGDPAFSRERGPESQHGSTLEDQASQEFHLVQKIKAELDHDAKVAAMKKRTALKLQIIMKKLKNKPGARYDPLVDGELSTFSPKKPKENVLAQYETPEQVGENQSPHTVFEDLSPQPFGDDLSPLRSHEEGFEQGSTLSPFRAKENFSSDPIKEQNQGRQNKELGSDDEDQAPTDMMLAIKFLKGK